jgi:hypothetical protein
MARTKLLPPQKPFKESRQDALYSAAFSGELEKVKQLTHNGADVNLLYEYKDYSTVLNAASAQGNRQVVQLLL